MAILQVTSVAGIIVLICVVFIPTSSATVTVSYDPNVPLKWDYFQGDVDYSSEYEAYLSYGITRSWTWQKINSSQCSYQIINFVSEPIIFTDKSWVKSDERDDSLLNHEQRHLDIAVIFNQKGIDEFNKYLYKELQCLKNSNDHEINNQVKSLVMDVFNSIEQEHREFQEKYDDEVDHGRNKIKQDHWNDIIDYMLGKFT